MKDISNASQPVLISDFNNYLNEHLPFSLEVMDEGYLDDEYIYGPQLPLPLKNPTDNQNIDLFQKDPLHKDIA